MKHFNQFYSSISCLILLSTTHYLYAQQKPIASAAIKDRTVAHAAKDKNAALTTKETTVSYTYKIIDAARGTFGYDIYKSGKLAIHQPTVPAMPGNEGFTTKAAAEKVAQLAIRKMAKGESLPTISIEELKKLKAF